MTLQWAVLNPSQALYFGSSQLVRKIPDWDQLNSLMISEKRILEVSYVKFRVVVGPD